MSFTLKNAVKLICKKLNDTNLETYVDDVTSASVDGLANDEFWQSIVEIISAGQFENQDVHGLVGASTAAAEEGIDLSSFDASGGVASIVDFYPPVDGAHEADALTKSIRLVTVDFFKQLGSDAQSFFGDDQILAYRVGDTLKFHPSSSASAKYVTVVYVKNPDVGTYSASTTGNLDLQTLFSQNFIYKAINRTYERMVKIKNID